MFKSTLSIKTAFFLGLVASAGSLLADSVTPTAPAKLKMGPHTARELHSPTAKPVPAAKTSPVPQQLPVAKVVTDVRGPTFAYQAKSGDTLSGLAALYGTTAAAIQALNPSVKEYAVPVVPGRTLTLPLPRTVKMPANMTLSHICARYGLEVNAVAAANGIQNPDHVVQGWVLQLWAAPAIAQR